MKKVAFCLRGAVSQVSNQRMMTQGSLYNNEGYVDYEKCSQSIFDYIVNKNKNYKIDFFCHSWNEDLNDSLNQIYNPKIIQTEDNNLYVDEIKENNGLGDKFSLISQALSTKKSIELKEQYEKENNFEYDIVILYRYDVLIWKKIDLEDYNLNDKNIYVNAHPDCGGDFHFIMNNNNSKAFKNLYGSNILPYPHVWVQKFVKSINKNLLMDEIVPGVDQEVIRKIQGV